MASKDIITRLKVDTKNHDTGLAKAKQSLMQYANRANSTDAVVKSLIGTFGKYVSGIAAASAAMGVLKDAFMSTEAGVDKWGRTVASAKGIYDSFLGAINNGNWNGFTRNINAAITEATRLYDLMDNLASYTARFNPASAAYASDVTTLLKQAKALKAKGDTAGAMSKIEEARKVASDADTAITKKGQKEFNTGLETLNALMHNAGYDRNKTLSSDQVMELIAPENFDRIDEVAKQFKLTEQYKNEAEAAKKKYQERQIQGYTGSKLQEVEAEGLAAWQKFNDQLEKYGDFEYQKRAYFFQNLNDETDNARGQAFNTAVGQMYANRTAAASTGMLNAQIDAAEARILGTGTKPKKADNLIKFDATGIADQLTNLISTEVDGKIPPIELPVKIDMSAQDFAKYIAAQAEIIREDWAAAANAIGQVSGALQQIENPAIKVAAIMAQAIATVIGAYAETLAKDKASKSNIFAFIGAAAASTISMLATVSSMKSAGKFAEGGVVGGNSYNGDRLIARVNSGESILTAKQTATALALMDSGNGVMSTPYVTADKIYLGLNNWLSSTGRGNIVTTRG